MNLSLCTISFRHHLISLDQIAIWASRHNFQGIELWGVHAQNMVERPEYDIEWLRAQNLCVPMLSDYLPLQGDKSVALEKAAGLCRLCQNWGAKKLRTFAGDKGSHEVAPEQRKAWVARMRELAELADAHGISLVVETHPNTLADTQASTLQLLDEIDHHAIRVNLDVIHVWEAGADPIAVLKQLEPVVAHMHLKNVSAKELLHVFAPANVYAPAGDRVGMVNLFAGAFDYLHFLRFVMTESRLSWDKLDASLEWFGPNVLRTLQQDARQLVALEAECHERLRPVADRGVNLTDAGASR